MSIHCYSNANGRHSRFIADVIISHIFGQKTLTWGSASLNNAGSTRDSYLKAIKLADKGDIEMLLEFARSSNMSLIIAAAIMPRCFRGNSGAGTR